MVIGLAGSGKTQHARKIGSGRTHIRDVWHHWRWWTKTQGKEGHYFAKFLFPLLNGLPWIADSVELCDPAKRDDFCAFLARYGITRESIKWVCFKNDAEQCALNAKLPCEDYPPAHEQVRLDLNREYGPLYVYEPGATIVPVYRG